MNRRIGLAGRRAARRRGWGGRAFTLIELLVVVAIIALLISILLPSLSKARAQARSTLCLSRIAQLGKAVLLYADDFDEYPPFVGCTGGVGYPGLEEIGGKRDPNENWLVSLPREWTKDELRDRFYCAYEKTWAEYGIKVPESGTLFSYTRFANLYRCPEFERISDPEKTQSTFNYVRAEWARRFRVPSEWGAAGFENEGGYALFGDFKGPLLRISAVFAPGALPMLVDEQWDRHVARPPYMFEGEGGVFWHWCDSDTLMSNHDEVGQYHGEPVQESEYYNPAKRVKRGGIFNYDGHADFRRDPDPSPKPDGRDQTDLVGAMVPAMKFLFEAIYAQRGMEPPMAIPDPPW
ncbi:MAG: prepilin-type N-terminal cleavage/methylation domain-containing protein [Phycisphaerae bacterium]|nr:prepilin-type N-terminal cleavage/methylation domain-containing protein [Phycisphaerae bacterium]